jgi:hypothetical protein
VALIVREPAKTVQIERAALVPVSAPFKLARVSFVSEARVRVGDLRTSQAISEIRTIRLRGNASGRRSV